MRKLLTLLVMMTLAVPLPAADGIKAAPGFAWHEYANGTFVIQVPVGWYETSRQVGIDHVVTISPESGLKHGSTLDLRSMPSFARTPRI